MRSLPLPVYPLKTTTIQKLQSHLDPAFLLTKVIDLPTTVDDGNVHMAYLQGTKIPETLDPYVRKAIEEIEILSGCPAIGIMINRLDPGQESPVHTDPGDHWRFHLPLQTVFKQVHWWDEINDVCYFNLGFWCGPVPYHLKHKVANNSNAPRYHLIIDVDPTRRTSNRNEKLICLELQPYPRLATPTTHTTDSITASDPNDG